MDKKTQCCQDVSFSHLICGFNAIPIKISSSYFVYVNKLILKFREANWLLKENKVEVLTLPNFKTYCKATEVKTV